MFRVISYAVMGWVGLSGIIFVFLQIFQCVPVRYIWEGWEKGAFGPFKCLDINALAFTTATFSIAQDIVILMLPLPLLAKLDVAMKSKLEIMFMFSLGFFVTITSCARLRTMLSFGDSVNPTWDYSNALIWTGLEVAVSIIVTSLPAIRVLLSRCFPAAFGSPPGNDGRVARGYTTTSSFGNDTHVASWYSGPPVLKRLSALSRMSSINVRRSNDEGGAREEEAIELDEILTGQVERQSCPADFPGWSAASTQLRKPTSLPYPLPNIGDVLSAGWTAERQTSHQQVQQTPEMARTESMASGTTMVGSDSGSDRRWGFSSGSA